MPTATPRAVPFTRPAGMVRQYLATAESTVSAVGSDTSDERYRLQGTGRPAGLPDTVTDYEVTAVVDERGLVWRIAHPLGLAQMQEAAGHLVGRHDFTTFRSVMCQAESPVKTLDALEIEELDLGHGAEFRFRVRARSFLHNQVRSLVGTLERAGAGAWSSEDVRGALAARDRAACGPVAPPDGLCLEGVGYPEDPFGAA